MPGMPPAHRPKVIISGSVTADDYSVYDGDTVTLTFTDTSVDVGNNSYQWIDENSNPIVGETTAVTNWVATLNATPPRILVTNSTTGQIGIFGTSIVVRTFFTADDTTQTIDTTTLSTVDAT